MQIKNKNVEKLVERYKEISLLNKVNALLGWDMNVNLPPKAADGRAEQSAYITKLVAEKWLDPEFRNGIEKLEVRCWRLDFSDLKPQISHFSL